MHHWTLVPPLNEKSQGFKVEANAIVGCVRLIQTPFGNVAETCRIKLGILEVPTLCNLAVQMFELVWIRQPLIVGRWKGAFMNMDSSGKMKSPTLSRI